jgi:hypothetical protein
VCITSEDAFLIQFACVECVVDRKLGEEYYRASVPVVDQQLAKAGVRLAKLLNDALWKK